MSEPHFLDFLELAPRSEKPRTRGLTIVKDPGYPTAWLRDLLDVYAPFIDVAKFPIGNLPFPARLIEQSIRLYRDFQIDVAVDDPMFQVAFHKNKVEEFFRRLFEVGSPTSRSTFPKTIPSAVRRRRGAWPWREASDCAWTVRWARNTAKAISCAVTAGC